ncbi:diguanylate cyclase [Trinickia caryophylli]|uniref:diguanylate cyclase n=1 Tax=Trinickia caryophylli TaxID=28094 RepID=A0A1X7EV79_TRICW|nr:diguanylate cyclase [Trinickia caryophylli]PMS12188.1 sensor domain-containing diguanylate cyclase [Trinickia caryophylli]TRX18504.1 GGDEF domain-containing protein [Trinickia caryophylli]WQE10707.1 diguanylate cyclase [Trinickia caryophylli]SMF40648.1 diguanylate cyclase (GGDEF) domain-containing protein [Trinickia caryophylli]GLU33079.1 diguanylate cyclase [Trinickia caryophylli]
MELPGTARLSELALERVRLGIFAVDSEYKVVLWNRFMYEHSGLEAGSVIGRSIFECFPALPHAWLKRKFDTVFLLHSGSFSSWQHHPWLLPFEHDCPITGSFDRMQQDCAFMPLIEGGKVVAVCVTIADVTELATAWREKEAALEALRDSSERDALTAVFNRRYVSRRLDAEYRNWGRHGAPLSVLLFDIDYFKRVNDTYGHPAGDQVLRHVASVASAQLEGEAALGRYGGEEFIAILPDCDASRALSVGERIRAAIAETSISLPEATLGVTVSAGGATVCKGTASADMLVEEADHALYDAKHGGRNQVRFAPMRA